MALLSLRAYSRHRGVTLRAVQKAIETARISTVLDEKGNKKIDQVQADAQWANNTNEAKQREPAAGDDKPPKDPGGSYAASRAVREHFMARLAKLEFEKESGKVVETDKVRAGWQRVVATAKTRLLSVQSKVKSRIPHLTLEEIAIIDEEIRLALSERSRGEIE